MYLPDMIRKEGLLRGLSPRTIKTYQQCIRRFFISCKKHPKEVKKKDVKDYLYNLIKKGSCGNTLNVNLCALKFLYEKVLNKRLLVNIRYSKTPKTLPVVLTQKEVKMLYDVIKNPKHKLMISLLYSAGLRLNELVSLKVKDLDFENNLGWVRKGKGNKDRIFILSEKLKSQLLEYIKNNSLQHHSWLFPNKKGYHLSGRTVSR